MKYIYVHRSGDRETFIKYKNKFEKKSISQLVSDYNTQVNIGITGVHQQGLYLIALRNVFISKIGESPITVEDDIVIGMQGEIAIRDGKINYINSQ